MNVEGWLAMIWSLTLSTLVGGAQVNANTDAHNQTSTHVIVSLLFLSCLKSNTAIANLWMYIE